MQNITQTSLAQLCINTIRKFFLVLLTPIFLYAHSDVDEVKPEDEDDDECEDKCDPGCQDSSVGDPFYLHTGEFYLNEKVLEQVSGVYDIEMYLNLHYRTYFETITPAGFGWMHNFHQRLRETNGGGLVMINEKSYEVYFESNGAGSYTSADRRDLVATPDVTSGGYIVTARDSSKRYFHAEGYLTKIEAPDGSALTLEYEGSVANPNTPEKKVITALPRYSNLEVPVTVVRDFRVQYVKEYLPSGTATGRQYTFAYDPSNGMLDLVTDQEGRQIDFTHESENYTDSADSSSTLSATNGNLSGFIDRDGNSSTYTYYSGTLPSTNKYLYGYMHTFSLIGCSECSIRENQYQSDGKITRQYQKGQGTTGETIQVYYSTTYTSVITSIELYEPATGTILTQDHEGNSYNESRTEYVYFEINEKSNKPTITRRYIEGESGSEFEYYPASAGTGRAGKVSKYTSKEGYVEEYDYYSSGMRQYIKKLKTAGATEAQNIYHVTEFTYTNSNTGEDLLSKTVYLSDNAAEKFITEYQYYASSGLMQYEKRRKADGTYATTEYKYHTSGNLEGLLSLKIERNTADNDRITGYGYNTNLTKGPIGILNSQYYLDSETSSAKILETTFEHDSVGRVVLRTEPSGLETHYTYTDVSKVLTETIQDSSGSVFQQITNRYDDNGRLIFVRSGNSTDGYRYTQHYYDLFGKPYKSERGTLASGADFSTITTLENPLKQHEVVCRDTEGLVYISEDATGTQTTNDYDSRKRMTSSRVPYSDSEDSTTAYVYLGNTSSVETRTDPAGRKTFYEYNGLGQITRQHDAYDETTSLGERIMELDYNALGSVTERRVLDSSEVVQATTKYQYDLLGRRIGVNWNFTTDTPDLSGTRELPMKYTFDDLGNMLTSTNGNGYTTTYSFDSVGRNDTITPPDSANYPNGNVTTSTFDDSGHLVRREDGRGIYRYFHNDERGQVLYASVETTADWLTTSWWLDSTKWERKSTSNAWGESLSSVTNTGAIQEITYDDYGRQKTTTVNKTLRSENTYRNLAQVDYVTTYEVQYSGSTETGTVAKGANTYGYSTVNPRLVTSMEDAEARKTGFTYTIDLQRSKVVNHFNYPASGSDLSSALGTVTTYDNFGRRQTVTNESGELTWFTYNLYDEVETTYLPTHFSDGAGRTEPAAAVSTGQQQMRYTTYGQLERQYGAQTYAIKYEYDLAGNRIYMTDNKNTAGTLFANGTVTRWGYDAQNRVTQKDYNYNKGNQTAEQSHLYSYNENGQLSTRTDGKGQVTTYKYETARNVPLSVDYPTDLDVLYTYDPNTSLLDRVDRLPDLNQPTVGLTTETSMEYDSYGRLDLQNQHGVNHLVDYGYDFAGRAQTTKTRRIGTNAGHASERTITKDYDDLSRLTSLIDTSVSASAFSITHPTSAAPVMSTTTPHGQQQRMTYDATSGRLTNANFHLGDGNGTHGTLLSGYGYTEFTDLGQRETIQYSGTAFETRHTNVNTRPDQMGLLYHPSGEVDSTTVKNPSNGTVTPLYREFSYDEIGNRESATSGTTTVNYTPNALNQYSAISSQSAPSFDDNGSLTDDGSKAYTWNEENRLIKVTTSTAKVEYEYNALGQRIERRYYSSPTANTPSKTTRYLLDQWNVLAEFDNGANTATREHTWGHDLSGSAQGAGGVGGLLATSESGNTYYTAFDGNGNITDYIKTDDTHSAHFEYGAFGYETTNWIAGGVSSEFLYRFSTKPKDFTAGLHYYGYRYYSAESGRWPSRDPIGERGGVNLYSFGPNNPISGYDVLGLKVCVKKRIDRTLFKTPKIKVPRGEFHASVQIRGTFEACDNGDRTLTAELVGAAKTEFPAGPVVTIILSIEAHGKINANWSCDPDTGGSKFDGGSAEFELIGWLGGKAGIGAEISVEGGFSASWDVSLSGDETGIDLDAIGNDVWLNGRVKAKVDLGWVDYTFELIRLSRRLGRAPDWSLRFPVASTI